MYIRNADAGAGYDLPANYSGTALHEQSPSQEPVKTTGFEPIAADETEAVEAAYRPPPPPPPPPQGNGSFLSRLLGGGVFRGGDWLNSDLLLIMIALLIFAEDGDSLTPLLIIALLLFTK